MEEAQQQDNSGFKIIDQTTDSRYPKPTQGETKNDLYQLLRQSSRRRRELEEEDAFPKVDFTETQNNTILLNISNRDEYSPLKSKHVPTEYKGSFAPNPN